MRLVYRPTITGAEHVPKHGAVILASNHLSFVDSIVIPLASPRPVQFLAKSSYFTGTGFSGWVSRTFFGAIGAVPVERGAGSQAQEALDAGKRILDDGQRVRALPRGHPLPRRAALSRPHGRRVARAHHRRHGRPRRPRRHRADPARRREVPAHPAGDGAIRRTARPRHHGAATSGRARRAATDEIMTAIQALSGQEPAGRYNEAAAARCARPAGRQGRPARTALTRFPAAAARPTLSSSR